MTRLWTLVVCCGCPSCNRRYRLRDSCPSCAWKLLHRVAMRAMDLRIEQLRAQALMRAAFERAKKGDDDGVWN